LNDQLNNDNEDEEVESNKTQFENEFLANELLSNDGINSNPGFNLLITKKDFTSFIRNNFSCSSMYGANQGTGLMGMNKTFGTSRLKKAIITSKAANQNSPWVNNYI
jgi:hypothetical protein